MSQKEVNHLRQLYLGGYTIKELTKVSKHSYSVVYSLVKNLAYFDPSYIPPPTRERRVKVDVKYLRKVRQQGYSIRQICLMEREHSNRPQPLSHTTIHKYLTEGKKK